MEDGVFRRKAYDALKEWKERSKGSTAVLVEGARRVGKTTLVQEFAEKEYQSHIIVDFYKANKNVKKLFDDLSNLDDLFRGLQLYYNTELKERDSVIVFDEVQLFPRAREAIKALVQDGRYDYIETGSLISIKKNVKKIIVPSEEEKIKLHPLDFEEYLWAKGINTFRLLYDYYRKRTRVDDNVHSHMMRLFREYLAVGGMPQAVMKMLEGGSYQDIDKVKREIIQLYLDDFRKMDPSGKLGRLYLAIPSELSSQSTRYRITETVPNSRLKRERKSFFDLEDSQTVQICRHVNDPKVGLTTTIDEDFFKMFAEDTGLFVTLCFYDKQFSENIIYTKLISGRLSANLGYVYENAVAQALTAIGLNLYYHTFKKKDDEKHYYEVDFITTVGEKLRPIECKSSNIDDHKSFDEFISKKGLKLDTPVIINPKNLKYSDKILYLPIYLTQFLDGKDYGSGDMDDSFLADYDTDDWIPVDDGYILYVKGKEHGKKNPVVDVFHKGSGGKKESLGADIEVDSHHNVKIASDEKIRCTVRIAEKDARASKQLITDAEALLDKLDLMKYGQKGYEGFKSEAIDLARKVYPVDVFESQKNEIMNVSFVYRVAAAGKDFSEEKQKKFDQGKKKMESILRDMIRSLKPECDR